MFSVCRYKTEIVVVVPHPTGGLGAGSGLTGYDVVSQLAD
jgi:hypothetical protein